jgi:pimeloyl-ACP methyl ester carboxylesterase
VRRPRLPPEVTGRTVATPRGSFAVLTAGEAGPDRPVVLLVPGWTGSNEDFLDLLPLLAAQGRLAVALDPRGPRETRATHEAEVPTLLHLAADVLAVAGVVADGPVDLVGHSVGGLVAAEATLAAPDDVRSLVLLCPGPGALPADRHGLLRSAELAQRPVPILVLNGELAAVDDPAGTARALAGFWGRWAEQPVLCRLELSRDSSQVPRARQQVRAALAGRVPAAVAKDAELVASELVTNAVVHAERPIELRVQQRGEAVEVRVSDAGARDRTGTVTRRPHHGRGLMIVDALADRHGSWTDRDGCHAWAQLSATHSGGIPPVGVATPPGSPPSPSGSTAAHGAAGGPEAAPSGQQTR